MNLAEQKCKPIVAGEKPLANKEASDLLLHFPGWTRTENLIEREFRFKDFRNAMTFVNEVAGIANDEDHHPDIYISYNKVLLELSTHKIGGLSLNDFIVAAKIDRMEELRRIGKAA